MDDRAVIPIANIRLIYGPDCAFLFYEYKNPIIVNIHRTLRLRPKLKLKSEFTPTLTPTPTPTLTPTLTPTPKPAYDHLGVSNLDIFRLQSWCFYLLTFEMRSNSPCEKVDLAALISTG